MSATLLKAVVAALRDESRILAEAISVVAQPPMVAGSYTETTAARIEPVGLTPVLTPPRIDIYAATACGRLIGMADMIEAMLPEVKEGG